jgi:voltage-gated potassium channel
METQKKTEREALRKRLYTTIFETSTPQGKKFDIYLLALILISLFVLMVESLPKLSGTARLIFYIIEWVLSITFLLEYIIRIWVSPKPMKYILSAWGIVDLLSILPIFLLAFSNSAQYFRIIRILRMIRIFRIFRINHFTREAYSLYHSLVASIYKISVFMFFVVILAIIMGGLMFMVEGKENGFDSVPESIYWAIVTLTTVGFGDITPNTDLGKFFASIMMLLGYAIIAVPTGIVSVEMFRQRGMEKEPRIRCHKCESMNDSDSIYCKHCGNNLNEQRENNKY